MGSLEPEDGYCSYTETSEDREDHAVLVPV
jgi:hypothetical protein